jgi:hypothetical protein
MEEVPLFVEGLQEELFDRIPNAAAKPTRRSQRRLILTCKATPTPRTGILS